MACLCLLVIEATEIAPFLVLQCDFWRSDWACLLVGGFFTIYVAFSYSACLLVVLLRKTLCLSSSCFVAEDTAPIFCLFCCGRLCLSSACFVTEETAPILCLFCCGRDCAYPLLVLLRKRQRLSSACIVAEETAPIFCLFCCGRDCAYLLLVLLRKRQRLSSACFVAEETAPIFCLFCCRRDCAYLLLVLLQKRLHLSSACVVAEETALIFCVFCCGRDCACLLKLKVGQPLSVLEQETLRPLWTEGPQSVWVLSPTMFVICSGLFILYVSVRQAYQ